MGNASPLIVCICAFVFMILVESIGKFSRALYIIGMIGLTYPIGIWMKLMHGPWFLRFWLCDLGFVPFMTVMLGGVFCTISKKPSLKLFSKSAFLGYVIAVIHEIWQFSIGTGDWIDMGLFMVTYFFTLRLLAKERIYLSRQKR